MKPLLALRWALLLLCAAGLCVGLAAASFGQSGMTPNPDGSSPALPTPTQQAQIDQRHQLDQAAALAISSGHDAEAVTDAQQAEEMYVGDVAAPLLIAQGLEGQGKLPEALKAYQMVLATRGGSQPGVLIPCALLLLNKGDWTDALATFDKALPSVANGELLRSHNDFSADTPAPVALAAAIHVARSLTFMNGSIVSVYTHHPEYDLALAENNKALALAPNSALANYYDALTLRSMGRKADAKAAFQKAATMDSGDVKAAAEDAVKRLGG